MKLRSGRNRLTTTDPLAEDRPVSTRSLRHRVMFSVLVLLLAVLLGLGYTVNTLLRDKLGDDLNQRLRDRAGIASALADQNLTGQQLATRLQGAGIDARVKDSTGTYYGQSQAQSNGPPNGPGGGPGPRGARPAQNVTITQDGPNLITTVNIGTSPNAATVTLTASRYEIDRTVGTLRNIELVAGAATLLIVALLLWRVVGVALAPLDRMTALARRIRDGARGRRLRPTKTNTEIGRTASAFDAMLDSLETAEASAQLAEADAQAAEARMRQFLADASHDLRTPLAGVISTAEGVLRDDPDRLAREQRLVALIREARRASRLVDDLLLMARLDGKTAWAGADPVALGLPGADAVNVVRTATEQATHQEPTRQIVTDLPAVDAAGAAAAAPVSIDADSLHRVLGNLVDNARRATTDGGTIAIGLRPFEDHVEIYVHDDGPGVSSEERGRIFDRFVRLADTADGRPTDGGHGLGLPIARGLVRRHGGELRYVEDGYPGATFSIWLPVSTTAPAEPLALTPAAQPLALAGSGSGR